jgi:aspartyl-tRNA(Asn)/glutamyl-tRNA(Gln) amidotransferase subunit B
MALRTLLRTVGASEADMEKGQLRAEPNISVRRVGGSRLGVKTELKNINSFRALHRAIEYEIKRQTGVLESGGSIVQETRGWSEAEQRTFSQRSKEFAEDYRYFPEPDLPPLELDRAWIDELRRSLPELPAARRVRLVEQYGLPQADAVLIASERQHADLFESTVALGAPPKSTANWIIGEALARELSPEHLAELVKLVSEGKINRDQGREVLAEAVSSGRAPGVIVSERGLAQESDASALESLVNEVITANPQAVQDYRAGKKQALGALMADLKKRAPHANPRLASELLQKALSAG